jgi:farnesyl diphosphate synthase
MATVPDVDEMSQLDEMGQLDEMSQLDEMDDLKDALASRADQIEQTLAAILAEPSTGAEARVTEAMRYSAMGGGKRLRGFLVMEGAALFGVDPDRSARVAAAIEAVHAYSLIHDDLPAMDDDDLRRGKPTCHIAFDEATAILAGDALQTLAFEILAHPETHEDPFVRCALVSRLAQASGVSGMVGGQMIDIAAETASEPLDIAGISRLQHLKTGALIRFSCAAGAIMGKAGKEPSRALEGYANDLGLAFQIHDDLLDVTGTAEETGKRVGKDDAAGKATFVSILGVDGARDQAQRLVDQAIAHLRIFDGRARNLELAAKFAISRRS